MSNRWSFTPQVQDWDGQSDSKHFDEESGDYLPSNSRKNQSEDDCESTDDGLDLFTNHQVHLSTSSQWVCLLCLTSPFVFFFSYWLKWFLLQNFWSLYTFLSENMRNIHFATFTQNLKVIETLTGSFFFSNLFCGSTHFSEWCMQNLQCWYWCSVLVHSCGADQNMKNDRGETAYDLASKAGYENIVKRFASALGQSQLQKMIRPKSSAEW